MALAVTLSKIATSTCASALRGSRRAAYAYVAARRVTYGSTLPLLSRAVPIPGYQDVMQPVLRAAAVAPERSIRDIAADVAREFALTPQELDARIPSGTGVFLNRIHWGSTYLKKAVYSHLVVGGVFA